VAAKPNLADVLRSVVRGRVARLSLNRAQKRALRDPDGQIALDVLRHLLGARAENGAPKPFPLTEQTFQAVASRLGYRVGIKKARALRQRLVETGVLEGWGSYRQPYRNRAGSSGFRVRLYRLGVGVRRSAALSKKRLSARLRPSSPRKRVRWWKHPLFGDYEGRPPPEWDKERLRKRASLDEYARGFGFCLPESWSGSWVKS
jgi:hypothetical protein